MKHFDDYNMLKSNNPEGHPIAKGTSPSGWPLNEVFLNNDGIKPGITGCSTPWNFPIDRE